MLAQDGHVGFAEFAHETEQGQSGLAVHEACEDILIPVNNRMSSIAALRSDPGHLPQIIFRGLPSLDRLSTSCLCYCWSAAFCLRSAVGMPNAYERNMTVGSFRAIH